MPDQFVKVRPAPVHVEAVRWQWGDPIAEVRALVLRGSPMGDVLAVDGWRLLLIRTDQPGNDPFYELVDDGDWLVYDPATGQLTAWDDDAFHAEYQSAAAEWREQVMNQRPPGQDARQAVSARTEDEVVELLSQQMLAVLTDPALGLTVTQQAAAVAVIQKHLREVARG